MSRSGGYKCYNIKCGSCIGKTLCGEPGDSALACDNRIVTHKTNADRIRSMSDEELAFFLAEQWATSTRAWQKDSAETLKWLRQTEED